MLRGKSSRRGRITKKKKIPTEEVLMHVRPPSWHRANAFRSRKLVKVSDTKRAYLMASPRVERSNYHIINQNEIEPAILFFFFWKPISRRLNGHWINTAHLLNLSYHLIFINLVSIFTWNHILCRFILSRLVLGRSSPTNN